MRQTPLKLHFQHFDNSHPATVARKLICTWQNTHKMVETYIFISFHKIIFQQKLVGWEILQTFKRDGLLWRPFLPSVAKVNCQKFIACWIYLMKISDHL
jgi:hypothetical protein